MVTCGESGLPVFACRAVYGSFSEELRVRVLTAGSGRPRDRTCSVQKKKKVAININRGREKEGTGTPGKALRYRFTTNALCDNAPSGVQVASWIVLEQK